MVHGGTCGTMQRRTGTVTVTSGSAAVVGTNTHFLSTVCDGSGLAQHSIVVWYKHRKRERNGSIDAGRLQVCERYKPDAFKATGTS